MSYVVVAVGSRSGGRVVCCLGGLDGDEVASDDEVEVVVPIVVVSSRFPSCPG